MKYLPRLIKTHFYHIYISISTSFFEEASVDLIILYFNLRNFTNHALTFHECKQTERSSVKHTILSI